MGRAIVVTDVSRQWEVISARLVPALAEPLGQHAGAFVSKVATPSSSKAS